MEYPPLKHIPSREKFHQPVMRSDNTHIQEDGLPKKTVRMTKEEKLQHTKNLAEELKQHDPIVIATAMQLGEINSLDPFLS